MVVRRKAIPLRRLALIFAIPTCFIVVGTLGYYFIENWSLFDSLYMTVITVTTVGYLEVHTPSVAGRAFTIFLALGGVFTLFYTGTEFVRLMISGEFQALLGIRRMERNLAALHDHLIVCGYGRMGRLTCQEFSAHQLPFVVIDEHEELLEDFDIPYGIPLHGDATSDETLQKAGVTRARALVAVAGSDADNLYITMSARLLNERLLIVARAEDEGAQSKLIRAGANRVVSPYIIGGSQVAHAVLRPTVVDFIELATRTEHLELQIEETQIAAGSPLAGSNIQNAQLRRDLGLIIVAIKKPDGRMHFNPAPDTVMQGGDILIALGSREQINQFVALATG